MTKTSSAAMEHYDFWNTPKISSGQPVIGVIEAVSQKKSLDLSLPKHGENTPATMELPTLT
jgi:hypothetical protein